LSGSVVNHRSWVLVCPFQTKGGRSPTEVGDGTRWAAVIVRNLADEYEPIFDHIGVLSKEMRQIVLLFEPMAIGHVKLIKRNKTGELFKAIKDGDTKLTIAKTSKKQYVVIAW